MKSIEQIEQRSLSALKPNPRNARTHSRGQIAAIARSIEAFGFTTPVLIDDDGMILAGHGRLEAAKRLGLDVIPTICLSHLNSEEKRAYVLADNKLAERSNWDEDLLKIELGELAQVGVDLDLTLTGFEIGEIDVLLSCDVAGIGDPPPPEPAKGPAISKPGNLWALGPHRLLCGDALSEASYTALMGGEAARMVFTDPPYNDRNKNGVVGKGKHSHDDFAMASGEMSPEAFAGFLGSAFGHISGNSVDGALLYACMDWRHMGEIIAAGEASKFELKNVCVWEKTNGGMGSLYRSAHEFVFIFKSGSGGHVNNIQLGRMGRNRTNVWHYAGANTFRHGRDADLADHPTVKPLQMVIDAICDASNRGEIVLDPFAGSGTTILAADAVGRRGYAMELDPTYVDVICRRWTDRTGNEPRLLETDEEFSRVAQRRLERLGGDHE